MRVLLVHDRHYGSSHSGERHVALRERDLLASHGVETRLLEWDPAPGAARMPAKAATQVKAVYSAGSFRRTRAEIASFRPDVVHVHNFWPQATPAVHYAAWNAGVRVVQTLHNYRLLCVADILLRDRQPCEVCIEAPFPWQAVRHSCVRGSLVRSAITAAGFGFHRLIDTWNRAVDLFIAPTESMRARFIRGGIDAHRIVVRPQWAPDHGAGAADRRYFLFVGRLSHEKGIAMLLDAWRRLDGVELHIAGAGALAGLVRDAAAECPRIRYLGALDSAAVSAALRGAIATIVPSLWEEPFPLVIAESYAAATPVIAADRGSRHETVDNGKTGLVFASGDSEGLLQAVSWAMTHPAECEHMGRLARQRYEHFYSAEAGWHSLREVYAHACQRSAQRKGSE